MKLKIKINLTKCTKKNKRKKMMIKLKKKIIYPKLRLNNEIENNQSFIKKIKNKN